MTRSAISPGLSQDTRMSSSSPKTPFTRVLQTVDVATGATRDIVVRLGLPEPDPLPGGDFRVLVEIEGFEQGYSRHVHGVDEIQAFLSACWLVPSILSALAPRGAPLTWLGEADLGFAPPAHAPGHGE